MKARSAKHISPGIYERVLVKRKIEQETYTLRQIRRMSTPEWNDTKVSKGLAARPSSEVKVFVTERRTRAATTAVATDVDHAQKWTEMEQVGTSKTAPRRSGELKFRNRGKGCVKRP